MADSHNRSIALEIIKEAALLLGPLRRIDDKTIYPLMRELGWELPAPNLFEGAFTTLSKNVSDLIDSVLEIGSVPSEERIQLILDLLPQIKHVLDDLSDFAIQCKEILEGYTTFLQTSKIESLFVPRLLDYLTFLYLQKHHPRLFGVLIFLGMAEIIVMEKDDQASPIQAHEPTRPYPLRTIHWGRITTLFTEPSQFINLAYGWGPGQQLNSELILQNLELLLRLLHLPGGIYTSTTLLEAGYNKVDQEQREVRFPLYQDFDWPIIYTELGLRIAPLTDVGSQGLAILPYATGKLNAKQQLGNGWDLTLQGSLDVNSLFGLFLHPPLNLEIKQLDRSSGVEGGHIELLLEREALDDFQLLFGSRDGTWLGHKGSDVSFYASKSKEKQSIGISLSVKEFTFVLNIASNKESDGLLKKLLSGIDLETKLDLDIGFSSQEGFTLGGSGSLGVELPVFADLGPLTIRKAFLEVLLGDELSLSIATSFDVKLGPVAGSIEKVGLMLPVALRDTDYRGNLGPFDVLSPKFLPPKGVAIDIDAAGLSGGGFLEIDHINGRYAGMLKLSYGDIGLKAVGLIDTRFPGSDRSGFALLVSIGVTFSPPIQLSFGFSLLGVGGLIGINRTMMTDPIREGLRNGTLDSILLPDDLIANSSQIISDMRTVFPPSEGRFVVGPVVDLGWGTPAIIQARLGIFLELPEPIRIVVLGQFRAGLPSQDNALIRINLDVVGILDFGKKFLHIEAALFDSKILSFNLYGDAAFRLEWGDNPQFALSLGGFHPKFTPPPSFPVLRRLTLELSESKDLQLSCSTYIALTSNSLQFGANVQLYAKAGPFSVEGRFYFDALFYFSPFSFDISLGLLVAVKFDGHNLAGIELDLSLSGPTPWNARGKAKIKILFLTISGRFNVTWGSARQNALPEIDPLEQLVAALKLPGSWSSSLDKNQEMGASLKSLETKQADTSTSSPDDQHHIIEGIVMHPLGLLEIRQHVLPLERKLQLFGNARVVGHDTFKLRIKINGVEISSFILLKDDFARGQFERLSEDQKLTSPSFEKMPSGIAIRSSQTHFAGTKKSLNIRYESKLIGADRVSRFKSVTPMPWSSVQRQVPGSTAARSRQRWNKRKWQSKNEAPRTVRIRKSNSDYVEATR